VEVGRWTETEVGRMKEREMVRKKGCKRNGVVCDQRYRRSSVCFGRRRRRRRR